MTTTQHEHNESSDTDEESEYAHFCNALESEYKQAKKDGLFAVFSVLDLDKESSDKNLIQAIDYFTEKDGVIAHDAPIGFLTEREESNLYRDGNFRPQLYCMFLSTKFAKGIENKTIFLKHSYKYAVDS